MDFDKAGSNITGIFRKEYQHKTPDGKNRKSKYIYLCSENELPVKPEGKWYHDIKALPAGWDKEEEWAKTKTKTTRKSELIS